MAKLLLQCLMLKYHFLCTVVFPKCFMHTSIHRAYLKFYAQIWRIWICQDDDWLLAVACKLLKVVIDKSGPQPISVLFSSFWKSLSADTDSQLLKVRKLLTFLFLQSWCQNPELWHLSYVLCGFYINMIYICIVVKVYIMPGLWIWWDNFSLLILCVYILVWF